MPEPSGPVRDDSARPRSAVPVNPSAAGADLAASEIDPHQPNAARVYDYFVGGTANFEADRQAAALAAAAFPGGLEAAKASVRMNRDFAGRVVRYLALHEGVRQFLDLGSGIPDGTNVHAVAQSVAPESRIVCVDYDPVVLAYAHEYMKSTPQGAATFLNGDFRDVEGVLRGASETLDLDKPVAVMLIALLHLFRDEDRPGDLVARYMAAVPPGSFLAVSHMTGDFGGTEAAASSLDHDMAEPMVLRDRAGVARFLDGLELVDPGVVAVDQWHPDGSTPTARASNYGAVGRKP